MCFPDSLIGNIPNLYYYAANNPSEVGAVVHAAMHWAAPSAAAIGGCP